MSWFGLSSCKSGGWNFDRFVQFWQKVLYSAAGRMMFLSLVILCRCVVRDVRDWGLKVKVGVRLL